MNILVCIKEVPDDSVAVSVQGDRAAIDSITPVVNAFDTYSLEMAVRLKEEVEGQVSHRELLSLNNGQKCRKPVFMRVSGIYFIKWL